MAQSFILKNIAYSFAILLPILNSGCDKFKNPKKLNIIYPIKEKLYVSDDCNVIKDGKPLRAIGVNYFDGFTKSLNNPSDINYEYAFKELNIHKIPFVRFSILPYWPKDAKKYIDNQQLLFKFLDKFVASAQRNNIGLIPTVFFNFATIPDVMGEPVSAWGSPISKTTIFARNFTKNLAIRYKSSSIIWAWEFSNEINDYKDSPDGYKYIKVSVENGTPPVRTESDNYTSNDLRFALRNFKYEINSVDTGRIVESGFNIPKNNAYNIEKNLNRRDTEREFALELSKDNESSDLISYHIYPINFSDVHQTRFNDKNVDMKNFIIYADNISNKICKPIFVGEFGSPDENYPTNSIKSFEDFGKILNDISESGASLSAAWVFDFSYQENNDGNFNMTFSNSRSNRLIMIQNANNNFMN